MIVVVAQIHRYEIYGASIDADGTGPQQVCLALRSVLGSDRNENSS